MDEQAIKLSEEIARLREQEGMTFKAMGERFQISPGRASYLYQQFLRRRRLAHYHEMHEKQNQMTVCVKMTLGEIAVLRRILSLYQDWTRRENSRRADRGNPLFKEPDCMTAEYLEQRFSRLEQEKRRAARKQEHLSPKTIDISDLD